MEWAIEDKGDSNENPFTLRKQEKKLEQLKQTKREMKNSLNRKKDSETVDNNQSKNKKGKKVKKFEKDNERLQNEKKALTSQLEKGKLYFVTFSAKINCFNG